MADAGGFEQLGVVVVPSGAGLVAADGPPLAVAGRAAATASRDAQIARLQYRPDHAIEAERA
jgi:hypothetical protein